jgi:hypothetical protein
MSKRGNFSETQSKVKQGTGLVWKSSTEKGFDLGESPIMKGLVESVLRF